LAVNAPLAAKGREIRIPIFLFLCFYLSRRTVSFNPTQKHFQRQSYIKVKLIQAVNFCSFPNRRAHIDSVTYKVAHLKNHVHKIFGVTHCKKL